MLIYYPDLATLSQFGIGIPVSDLRAPKCIEYLSSLPFPGAGTAEILIGKAAFPLTREDINRVHTDAYTEKMYGQEREALLKEAFELVDDRGNYNRYHPESAVRPLRELFDLLLLKAAGTLHCTELALEKGFCFYFGGGFHHAHPGFGHGFCLINDIMIAAAKLLSEKRVSSIWIIDVDAHKGDGTAAMAQNFAEIKTLSIHMGDSWPLDRERTLEDGSLHPSFIPSDIDIPIFQGEEEQYNQRLSLGLEELAPYPSPDLAIVVSGSDPYEKDTLPSTQKMNLTLPQISERDSIVYRFLSERSIPAAYLMAGGYSPESWEVYAQLLEMVLVDRHMKGLAR
jgi:acetoin utilization deacetylase AcuC-like enzyme